MPHLHLSLQAGDDLDPQAHEAAASARRRHRASASEVRRLRPDMVFGADIIAGFPTENEAMFARSLDIVDECGLTHLHVFPVLAPARHAGRAHAAGAARRREGARPAPARRGAKPAFVRHLASEVGARRTVLVETEPARPHGRLHPRALRVPVPGESARRDHPGTTGGAAGGLTSAALHPSPMAPGHAVATAAYVRSGRAVRATGLRRPD